MEFNKEKAFDEFTQISMKAQKTTKPSEQFKVMEELMEYFQKVYDQGYQDGLKDGKKRAFNVNVN